jgi:glycerol-3-phosphate dehydrogenase
VRLVKGSHIVVPKIHSLGHAYILQNPDKRVIFVIPFERRFSLIGTTDVPVASVGEAERITREETQYLLSAANRFLAKPLSEADVLWSYSGVRPLYDDGTEDPSAITRDYVIKLEAEADRAPLLSIFGGKITTYRCLAETVLARLERFYPSMGRPWTGSEALPGGDMANFNAFRDEIHDRYKGFPREMLEGVMRRHGSRTAEILGAARKPEDLGMHFGAGLTGREVEHLIADEWAETADDILWRRTKCGLHMDSSQRSGLDAYLASRK